ncbi:sulfiredoxin, chloroplastic/mitochondrial isoform X2 [Herrania umbratica]|uniref:Sulfiredoxin, chloroplastic/mitochondrial isoform X2 n=1 Tax=Herrania umbratica TaxID=108875 RepID=A0A6J1AGR8_9ROSI|nr:sulfiredoxin, chloroplastic/mitochondrial isoform X2 [Herrania umbratica]
MANFVLQLPTSNLRNFSVYASSNGAPPGTGSQSGGPVILELPLDKVRRPLMRTRANDPNKVQELMDSIREIGLQIDVLEVEGVYYGNVFNVSPVVIVMRLTSALGSQQSVAKFDVEPKKLSGIIFAEW